MISQTVITITEDPAGAKHYAYELREGDVHQIAHRWILNCGQSIPRPGTLFHFGGRALVVIREDLRRGKVEAIDAQRFWWARYQLRVPRVAPSVEEDV